LKLLDYTVELECGVQDCKCSSVCVDLFCMRLCCMHMLSFACMILYIISCILSFCVHLFCMLPQDTNKLHTNTHLHNSISVASNTYMNKEDSNTIYTLCYVML
jgi:hypothetical protein